MTARIRIGTCSWTDPQLIKAGTFYPPYARDAESRLRFYSENFSLVEVDSTYYALPAESTARLWVDRTPPDFVFDIKAFSLFTNHPTKTSALPRDIAQTLGPMPKDKANLYYRDLPDELRSDLWRRFVSALAPLSEAKKLGNILLQFPPWFNPTRDSEAHIIQCAERLKPYRCSIEFRSASWLSEKRQERTLSFLRSNDLAFVCVDEPQGFGSSVPPIVAVTSDTASIRFHGRNAATWERKGLSAAERFNWYYTEDQFREWVPRIQEMASQAREIHALMNTNYSDQGIANALLLQGMLNFLD